MPNARTSFNLRDIISGVTSADLVAEILDLYEELLAEHEQFNLAEFFPVLEMKLSEMILTFDELVRYAARNRDLINVSLSKFYELCSASNTIFGIASTEDRGGSIHAVATDIEGHLKHAYDDLKQYAIQLLDHETQIGGLNTKQLVNMHNMFRNMFDKRIVDENYFKRELVAVDENLSHYTESILSEELREGTASICHALFELRYPIEALANTVSKERAKGAFLGEIIPLTSKLHEALVSFLRDFVKIVNAICLTEMKQIDTAKKIAVYQALVHKLLSAS